MEKIILTVLYDSNNIINVSLENIQPLLHLTNLSYKTSKEMQLRYPQLDPRSMLDLVFLLNFKLIQSLFDIPLKIS